MSLVKKKIGVPKILSKNYVFFKNFMFFLKFQKIWNFRFFQIFFQKFENFREKMKFRKFSKFWTFWFFFRFFRFWKFFGENLSDFFFEKCFLKKIINIFWRFFFNIKVYVSTLPEKCLEHFSNLPTTQNQFFDLALLGVPL